jgi:hypothetical protein
MKSRETELAKPGALDKKPDPPLSLGTLDNLQLALALKTGH